MALDLANAVTSKRWAKVFEQTPGIFLDMRPRVPERSGVLAPFREAIGDIQGVCGQSCLRERRAKEDNKSKKVSTVDVSLDVVGQRAEDNTVNKVLAGLLLPKLDDGNADNLQARILSTKNRAIRETITIEVPSVFRDAAEPLRFSTGPLPDGAANSGVQRCAVSTGWLSNLPSPSAA